MSPWTAIRISAALPAFAVFCVLGTGTLIPSVIRCFASAGRVGETVDEGRKRTFGAAYASAINRIRQQLPEASEYLLVDASSEPGAAYTVRYDLAPRGAILLGPPQSVSTRALRSDRKSTSPFVVIARDPGLPPLLMSRREFLSWLKTLRSPHAP